MVASELLFLISIRLSFPSWHTRVYAQALLSQFFCSTFPSHLFTWMMPVRSDCIRLNIRRK